MCFVEPVCVWCNTGCVHQVAALHCSPLGPAERPPPVTLLLPSVRKRLLMRCESLLMIIGRHGSSDNSTVRKMRPEEGRGRKRFHPAVVQMWYGYHTRPKLTADKGRYGCRPHNYSYYLPQTDCVCASSLLLDCCICISSVTITVNVYCYFMLLLMINHLT